jgi:hypothetical protein
MELLAFPKSMSKASPPPKKQATSDRSSVASLMIIRKWRDKVLEKV